MRIHSNNIGLLRLILALTVIASHGPLIHAHDGVATDFINRTTHLFGLGIYVVDFFFILSGYLIAQSFQTSATTWEYLAKRILRIFPAFILAYPVSIAVATLCAGQSFDPEYWRILILQQPPTAPVKILSQTMNETNLSMWSIDYEFRQYLVVILLAGFGLLQNRRALLKGVIALAILYFVLNIPNIAWHVEWLGFTDESSPWWLLDSIIGIPYVTVRLTLAFWVGIAFRLYREEADNILTGRNAAICAAVLLPCLFFRPTAETGVILLGSVILFWFAFKARLGGLRRINDRWDISYGVYLYGWPSSMLLLHHDPYMPLWLFYPASVTLAVIAGTISWFGVERHFRWKKRAISAASTTGGEPAGTDLGVKFVAGKTKAAEAAADD